MIDTDLDHFRSVLSSATDYNKPPSDSQSIGFSPVAHVRSSKVHTSMQPRVATSSSRAIPYSPEDFAPYTSSGAGSFHFRGQPSRAAFQSTADRRSDDTHSEDSPMFPDDFNGDFDSAALCIGQTPVFMAKDASSNCSLASASGTASTCRTECSSSRTSDVLPGLFSSGPQYGVSPCGPQNLLKGIETCSESRRTCMTSAIRILQKLHIPPSACLSLDDYTSASPASRQPRKTDSVLSTNRDVVLLMAEMLKCSCLSSSQIQLVLTIICGKLIAWYRAIIRNSPDDHPNACTGSDEPPAHPDGTLSPATGMHNERVLHQPFTVGEYSLDISLDSKIRAQVVSSELQRLEALIANFSRRIQEQNPNRHNFGRTNGTRSRNTSTMSSAALSSSTLNARLIKFLQKQLRDAKEETIGM